MSILGGYLILFIKIHTYVLVLILHHILNRWPAPRQHRGLFVLALDLPTGSTLLSTGTWSTTHHLPILWYGSHKPPGFPHFTFLSSSHRSPCCGSTMTLSASVIASEVPLALLSDLQPDPDIENDVEVLLQWLLLDSWAEDIGTPTPRTKAAARRCLHDPTGALQFVRLWLNTIRPRLEVYLLPVVAHKPIAQSVAAAEHAHLRCAAQALHLRLPPHAAHFFARGLAAMFALHFALPQVERALVAHLAHTLDTPLVRTLSRLGLASSVRAAVVQVCVERVRAHTTATCTRRWEMPVLADLEDWVRLFARGTNMSETLGAPVLSALMLAPNSSRSFAQNSPASPAEAFSFGGTHDESFADTFDADADAGFGFDEGAHDLAAAFTRELVRISRRELLALRTREIYDLVAAFPDTQPALSELHACLEGAGAAARTLLVVSFAAACTARLLHLGSTTAMVVLAYMRTIRAFLVIDPSGVLLDKVARPIRRHLRLRADLVPLLSLGMLDVSAENPLAELAHELRRTNPTPPVVDDLSDLAWVPDPIDALPDFQKGKAADVLDAVVSVLPLSALLVDELTRVLGDRLLQWHQYDAADVVHHAALLKARFGAAEFATLDVMVRDVADSTHLNHAASTAPLQLSVLSRLFWPSLGDTAALSPLQVPVQREFDLYSERFAQTRKGRSLALVPSLGTVTLDLIFAHSTRLFTVTPAQAAVVYHFDDAQNAKSVRDISAAIGLSEYDTLRALTFWTNHGVMVNENGAYRAVE